MGKNDFDIDFDFEKEYGFDPKDVLGNDELIDDMDFSDEDLGLTSRQEKKNHADFDLDDDLNMDDFLNMAESAINEDSQAYFRQDPVDEEIDVPDFFDDDEDEETYPQEEDYEEPVPQEQEYLPQEEEDEFVDESMEEEFVSEDYEADEEAPVKRKRERKPIQLPKINLPKIKLKTPNIFTKFYGLYFAPVLDKSLREEPQDPNNPRRRRRKSKQQVFKEVYLPPIIICVSLILVLSFTIGSVSNFITEKQAERAAEQSQVKESQDAAELEAQRYERIMAEAEELALNYDYNGAIQKLESFGDMTNYPDMQSKRAQYVTTMSQLVEYKDISTIPNLSFHVLMADPVRAFMDTELGGSYNRNFVTTTEFSKILEHLYANGYVLVDFDNVTGSTLDATGNETFFPNSLYLPADKKPVMITETMVNYFNYMIDGDGDQVADAKGDGFASKLVIQGDTVKAEYVDSTGQTLIGDFDFVPILESFIAQHPDFSYQGARATLAVCGYEGVFGYRTNTSYIATKGNDYYNNEVSQASAVANKLREMGYTIACYTYGNEDYSGWTANQISADMQLWTQQITPVLGNVDTIVFARAKDIQDYNGNAFQVLYTSGFRYFVAHSSQQP